MIENEAAMRAVMETQPFLTDFGFGLYCVDRVKPLEERRAIFEKERADLLADRSLEEFEAARRWLRQWPKTKRINSRSGTSYGLKHVAEKEIGYSTNGVFIAAALAEGFEVRMEGPNALFNITAKAWRR